MGWHCGLWGGAYEVVGTVLPVVISASMACDRVGVFCQSFGWNMKPREGTK